MKIAIDVNELTSFSPSGVKTYTKEIVGALLEVDRENEYFLCAQKDVSKEFRFSVGDRNSCFLKILKWPLPFWTYVRFAWEIKKQKPDVLFMPIQTAPFLIFKPKKVKIIITIHDLAFLKFPNHFTFKNKVLLNWHTRRAIKMADKIIVPSRATKNDLVDLCKIKVNKIAVIYHGHKKNYYAASKDTKFCVPTTNHYILFVGTIQPRKNIINLIKAFEIFKKTYNLQPTTYKLVIAGGKGWLWKKTLERVKKSPVKKDIILTGAVSDQELAELYSKAKVFVLPSLYEGFGLPILEAFAYDVPVIAADNSSLSEIVGNAGLLVNSGNPREITKAIKKIVGNDDLRNDLIKKGKERLKDFSWEKSARKHLGVFRELL